MMNKNKYSTILTLCCILSHEIYGAASSSGLSTADSGTASQNLVRLECFTPKTLYRFPAVKNPENSKEIEISSISGEDITYGYNEKDHNWKVTNDGKEFTLSIGYNLCLHLEENAVNIYVVKLFIDPNDPMKCIFYKLGNFRDTNTQPLDETEQKKYDRAKMYLLSKAKFLPTKTDYDAFYEIEGDSNPGIRYFREFSLESNSRLRDYMLSRPDIYEIEDHSLYINPGIRYFREFCLESNSRLRDYIRNRPDIYEIEDHSLYINPGIRYFREFCLESNSRLRDYIRNRPDIALPLIKNYINEIEILFQQISRDTARIILENAPDLLDPNPNPENPDNQSNLDKFFHRSNRHYDVYVVLSNLQTTLEDKINQLR